MPKSKALLNKDGSIDFIDPETGEVQATGKAKTVGSDGRSLEHQRQKSDYDFRWKTAANGDHLLVPADVEAKNLDPKWSLYANRRDLCLEIAMEIAAGKTFYQLDKLKQFPSTRTVFYWYARDLEFKNLIDEARRVRAEFYHDQLVEVAEDVEEQNARSSKVKADIFKHLMGVNDRDRFGQAPKTDAAPPVVNIIFSTGIDRPQTEVIDVTPEQESTFSSEDHENTKLLALDGSENP
jgi:hypothetical protein